MEDFIQKPVCPYKPYKIYSTIRKPKKYIEVYDTFSISSRGKFYNYFFCNKLRYKLKNQLNGKASIFKPIFDKLHKFDFSISFLNKITNLIEKLPEYPKIKVNFNLNFVVFSYKFHINNLNYDKELAKYKAENATYLVNRKQYLQKMKIYKIEYKEYFRKQEIYVMQQKQLRIKSLLNELNQLQSGN